MTVKNVQGCPSYNRRFIFHCCFKLYKIIVINSLRVPGLQTEQNAWIPKPMNHIWDVFYEQANNSLAQSYQ